MDLHETVQFGPYRLLRQLGSGGMAVVYLAERQGPEGFSKQVALKVIREELLCRPDVRETLVNEARLSQRLSHGNVVHTYDFGEEQGRYFLAMEYVDGW